MRIYYSSLSPTSSQWREVFRCLRNGNPKLWVETIFPVVFFVPRQSLLNWTAWTLHNKDLRSWRSEEDKPGEAPEFGMWYFILSFSCERKKWTYCEPKWPITWSIPPSELRHVVPRRYPPLRLPATSSLDSLERAMVWNPVIIYVVSS